MKIDIKDFSKLARGFVDIPKACATALKNTFNVQAALTRKNGIEEIKQDFIIRNNFSEKSIAYDRCKTDEISTMQASVGALTRAEYLALQHEGGQRRPKALFKKLAIPQDAARGGSRKRLVSRSHYLEKIAGNVVRGRFKKHYKSKKAQAVARAYVAKQNNLFLKYDNNIFSVTSFSKFKKRVKFKSKHLYNVGERTAKIKGKPWLTTSAQKPAADGQAIFNSQVKKLLAQKKII
ncbi:MAG: hypothetical protein PHS33_08170 [Candidatus Omnitrophica bacterium]|nr:hypothetical protein [Candidatus Omnitrophota bacterium]